MPKIPPPPTAVFASAHDLSELDLLREPLSAAAHTTEEHVRKLEPSGAFSCSKMKLACVKSETSQMTYLGESNSTLSDVQQMSREGVKHEWKRRKQTGRLTGPTHRGGLATIPSSFLRAPPGLTLPVGSRPDFWQNELLCRAGDIDTASWSKNEHFLRDDGAS